MPWCKHVAHSFDQVTQQHKKWSFIWKILNSTQKATPVNFLNLIKTYQCHKYLSLSHPTYVKNIVSLNQIFLIFQILLSSSLFIWVLTNDVQKLLKTSIIEMKKVKYNNRADRWRHSLDIQCVLVVTNRTTH